MSGAGPSPSQQQKQQQPRRSGGNAILVNYARQKENPVLRLVHNVPWEPSDVIRCDFAVGQTTGVLYLR